MIGWHPHPDHGDPRSVAARRSVVLLVASAALVISARSASAQRPVTPARRTSAADTNQHSPFIPGGHWRPGRPAPVPEPVPDLVTATPSAVTDSAGYFSRPNGVLLRPGTSVFRLALRRDTLLIPLGTRTVTVSDAMLVGVSDWLIAEARTGSAIATSDSLHLRRADLAPMRWTARNGVSQLAVSFTADSMFTALQDYQGRGSFADALPPGALITPGMVDRLLELLPLSAGYRANASVVVVDSGMPRAVPATISVEGEETVTLNAAAVADHSPAATASSSVAALPSPGQSVLQQASAPPAVPRTFDCWLVILRAGSVEKRYWVAKSPQRVVKTEQFTSGGVLTETVVE
jgi:hypothetical protein